jgi:hypothetical protein
LGSAFATHRTHKVRVRVRVRINTAGARVLGLEIRVSEEIGSAFATRETCRVRVYY